MQYIVGNCGVIELLSGVTLPSETTVQSSGMEQQVLRAVRLPASVLLPWLSLTRSFCADAEENLSAVTLKSAVDHDGVEQVGKLCPPPGKLLGQALLILHMLKTVVCISAAGKLEVAVERET